MDKKNYYIQDSRQNYNLLIIEYIWMCSHFSHQTIINFWPNMGDRMTHKWGKLGEKFTLNLSYSKKCRFLEIVFSVLKNKLEILNLKNVG